MLMSCNLPAKFTPPGANDPEEFRLEIQNCTDKPLEDRQKQFIERAVMSHILFGEVLQQVQTQKDLVEKELVSNVSELKENMAGLTVKEQCQEKKLQQVQIQKENLREEVARLKADGDLYRHARGNWLRDRKKLEEDIQNYQTHIHYMKKQIADLQPKGSNRRNRELKKDRRKMNLDRVRLEKQVQNLEDQLIPGDFKKGNTVYSLYDFEGVLKKGMKGVVEGAHAKNKDWVNVKFKRGITPMLPKNISLEHPDDMSSENGSDGSGEGNGAERRLATTLSPELPHSPSLMSPSIMIVAVSLLVCTGMLCWMLFRHCLRKRRPSKKIVELTSVRIDP